ncbi:PIN domain-like protein [Trametopsis cervina]|nr:PIN domain-like protein [Trametopsis cervina]
MGVKSLWNLLDPVGRPVLLETMEGKAMAIDSSIWIYQFQATMRDKEGRGLVNAPVVGFLRRISKLLFYGIKPVFVFDGGAPALKRSTITERKRKKSGAAASHAKVAERLLAAHMRRAALDHAQGQTSQGPRGKSGVPTGPVTIDENTVYLEDLEGSGPSTPAKSPQKDTQNKTPPSSKKSRWHDHDPYKLPDVNLDEAIAKATRSAAPDPRLATEDELRAFIDEMKPEDFDVGSPAFRELPTEVQYEIIGDLRLRSRQTSYKRLQNMLKNAKTPLDFSKEQIKNLKQRNSLTQQLLMTTDSIGKAHVEIPIRIASERNKQYILVKNEGESGGWILGVRDEGTRAKPIEIDQEPAQVADSDDSDMDMEEVPIEAGGPADPDLKEYQRNQALQALAHRLPPKHLSHKPVKRKREPLFIPEDLAEDAVVLDGGHDDDAQLAVAIQESLEHEEANNLQRALEASKTDFSRVPSRTTIPGSNVGASTSGSHTSYPETPQTPATRARTLSSKTQDQADAYFVDSDDDLYASPTRLETALSIANAGPKKLQTLAKQPVPSEPLDLSFGVPTLLLSSAQNASPDASSKSPESDSDMEEVMAPHSVSHTREASPKTSAIAAQTELIGERSDDDGESLVEISPDELRTSLVSKSTKSPGPYPQYDSDHEVQPSMEPEATVQDLPAFQQLLPKERPVSVISDPLPGTADSDIDGSDDEDGWDHPRTPIQSGVTEERQKTKHEDWDAAQEMDPQAEAGEYAQFMSQVRGKNLEDVRREIDEEIKALNQQRKIAMRDSEDVTQQMISQIMMMLRLFGIPYITAPMEAEAQCAELLSLGLVDGIITDDSDVFLFGGLRVLRNMFNQSKTVECFLLTDLERELSLDRDKLVRLAYLLGSDYTEGLPGVGPVVAMELLTEFSGPGGLHEFREWWRKVQSGQDTPADNKSKFRQRFKKRFKELFLPEDWPNPAVVRLHYK